MSRCSLPGDRYRIVETRVAAAGVVIGLVSSSAVPSSSRAAARLILSAAGGSVEARHNRANV
jgi:hypothetical protein